MPLPREEARRATRCFVCETPFGSQKTWRRPLVELGRKGKVSVEVLVCGNHTPNLLYYPPALSKLIPERRLYSPEVMAAVGLLRWGMCQQRGQVITLLSGIGTSISAGEVSILAEEFLLRFYLMHERLVPLVRDLLEKQPGRVYHIDGTMEDGSKVVFTCREEISGIVLGSTLLNRESKEEVAAFLREIGRRYGPPDLVIRDMSNALAEAVSEVWRWVPQQVCHVHFVKALGNRLFEKLHGELRESVHKTKALAGLRELRASLPAEGDPVARFLAMWVHLAVDIVDSPRCGPADFPFRLAYLEVVERVLAVEKAADGVISDLARANLHSKPLGELQTQLLRIRGDSKVMENYRLAHHFSGWFMSAREALRLVRGVGSPRVAPQGQELDDRIRSVAEIVRAVGKEALSNDERVRSRARSFLEVFEEHWDELFVRVHLGSGELAFHRDNNVSESGHRWSRMRIRRSTGKRRTTREMSRYGPLLAVFENFHCKTYADYVLSRVPSLVMELMEASREEVDALRARLRANLAPPELPVPEKDRLPLLELLPSLMAKSPDDLLGAMEQWAAHVRGVSPTLV